MIIKGTAYINGNYENCYIGIENGKIDFLKKSLKTSENVKKMKGVIIPAGIDLHVHFRDPGMKKKEDFYSGSVSAACGGITTVMDMPNTVPPTDSYKRLKEKINNIKKKSVIDFGLYGLLSEDIDEMIDITKFFKVFMSPTTDIKKIKMDDLYDLVQKAYSYDAKIAFHCEDEDYFMELGNDLRDHNENRPIKSEIEAIKKLKDLPQIEKYICHLTSKKSLNMARELGFLTEVTPHHIFLSDEALLGPFGKVNPPLRGDDKRYEMWEAFERNEIDFIASDHAPHLEEEKQNFEESPSGMPGVETMYPLLLESVSRGEIDLSTVLKCIAENPAKRLGLKRGKIKEGFDAELINIDFRDIETIKSKNLHYKCGWSPFEGFQGVFPKYVISQGDIIVEDKEFVGNRGRGRYIEDI